MKNTILGLLVTALIIGVPSNAFAETDIKREAMLKQIASLIELVASLKAQIAEQQATKNWDSISQNTYFSISYPKNWGVVYYGGVYMGFYDEADSADDYTWSVKQYDIEENSVEDLIDEMGEGYSRPSISNTQVTINGQKGKYVVVKDKRSGDEHISIFISGADYGQPETLFVISNEGSDAPYFEKFYKSFKIKSKVKEWKETTPVTARGTLQVKSVNSIAMKLDVAIYPPTDCQGDEQIEFVLSTGNGETRTYEIEDCEVGTHTENIIYTPSLVPVFAELTMRQVDTANNVWMNYLQVRYKIDLSNPLVPSIQKLDVNGSKG